jgi:hypothetical protein
MQQIAAGAEEAAGASQEQSAAIKLIVAVQHRIDTVPDYVEYWDHIRASGKDVGTGLLYDLIKNGDPLPSGFETSRQRASRRAAEERRSRLRTAKQSLEFEYDEYRRAEVDRYIAEGMPKDEYEALLAEERKAVSSQHGLWSRNLPAETLEQMAVGGARRRVADRVTFASFDEFCRREARRILADYQIDPSELGISAPENGSATAN